MSLQLRHSDWLFHFQEKKKSPPQMLLRTRLIVPALSLPHHCTFSHQFSTNPDNSSSTKSNVDKECGDFSPWLERKAGVQISSNLYVGKSPYGRSLFASKRIQARECILKVPYRAQISSDMLLPIIKTSLDNDVVDDSKLAFVLLIEQRFRREESDWAPYISCLPQPDDMHSTIFWSESELDMIRQSSVYQETIKEKAQIEKDFRTIQRALQDVPEITGSFTLKDFMHAYSLVSSRAWGSTKGVSLIPFADFLNHDGLTEAVLIDDEEKQVHEVIADRNYAPHEEVLIRYGKFSNATLLLDFGFTLPYNLHDQVHFQMNIPHHHFLHEMKLEILQRCRAPTIDNSVITDSGGSVIIKEVRSAIGKGKGLPQLLRAFARVLSCTSPQDLHDLAVEAVQHDGRLARRPFECSSREILSHEILLSQINELVEEYNASIKSLVNFNPYTICKRFALRRQMALDLLNGELRVLKSASSWLKNYCAAL